MADYCGLSSHGYGTLHTSAVLSNTTVLMSQIPTLVVVCVGNIISGICNCLSAINIKLGDIYYIY